MLRRRLMALFAVGAAAMAVGVVLLASLDIAPPRSAGASAAPVSQPASSPARLPDATNRPAAEDRTKPTLAQRRLARLRGLEAGIKWRSSTVIGAASGGQLIDGVQLPPEGVDFFTLDPVNWTSPNRADRLWGSDRLVRTVLDVAREYAKAHPDAPRIAVGDLSRPSGGSFDATYGIVGEFGPGNGTLGHVSHQNGLDVDIYYPRKDGQELGPRSLADIDYPLSQDLVDRFVAAGAELVLVGPGTGLVGPPGIVASAERHDDHIHVRLPAG